jgi:SMODS-associating 2TM, beta-strand rich effector domain
MARFVKAILYTTVAVWAVILFFSGQSVSSTLLRPFSRVTSIVVLLGIAFELWLWKLPFLHGWFVRRPVIDGTWRAELRSNWKDAGGGTIPPIQGYMIVRQTLLNLSLRLLTAESRSVLVGTEIVCSADGLYCVSGVYRNEPHYQNRGRSPIHYGAVWLQVIEKPTQKLEGHYWTDRKTAGELRLTDRRKQKFQDFDSAQAHYARP